MAARIAEVALWLMDHQMDPKVSESFGQLYQRLPLKKLVHSDRQCVIPVLA
jgi:MmeI, DNA-methyltransferase domain